MNIRFHRRPTSAVAALLLVGSAGAFAGSGHHAAMHSQHHTDASALHIFSGEALAPEVEMRAMQSSSGALSRAEVRAELMAARDAGTLGMAGEIAEPELVLARRESFNFAQRQQILAQNEFERARMALNDLPRDTQGTVVASASSVEPAQSLAAGETLVDGSVASEPVAESLADTADANLSSPEAVTSEVAPSPSESEPAIETPSPEEPQRDAAITDSSAIKDEDVLSSSSSVDFD